MALYLVYLAGIALDTSLEWPVRSPGMKKYGARSRVAFTKEWRGSPMRSHKVYSQARRNASHGYRSSFLGDPEVVILRRAVTTLPKAHSNMLSTGSRSMPQTRRFSSSRTNSSSADRNYLDRHGKGFWALITAILGLMVTVFFHTTQVEEHQLLGRKIDHEAVDHTVLKIHRPLALANQEVKPNCHPRLPRPGMNLFALQTQHMDFTQRWK